MPTTKPQTLAAELAELRQLYADRSRDLAHEHKLRIAAEAEVKRLRAALEAVEWVPYEGAPEDEDYAYCPWCNSIRKHGHEKIDPAGCQRQSALGIQP